MASPCEVLLDAPELNQAQLTALCEQLVCETWRIEHKYSRYQTGNIIHTPQSGPRPEGISGC